MLLRAVVICSFAALLMFRAFAGVEALDTRDLKALPWFANTKEYKSLLSSGLPELTENEAAGLDPVVREFFSKSNERSLNCESEILASLALKLQEAGVSPTRRTIRGALRLAREIDLVDDLALTPLLWILDAVDPLPLKNESDEDYAQMESAVFPYAQVAPAFKSAEERKLEAEKQEQCDLEKLKKPEEQNPKLLQECSNLSYSRLSSQCSVVAFKSTQSQFKEEKGETAAKKVKASAVYKKFEGLAQDGVISSLRSEYYRRLYEAEVQKKSVTWAELRSRVQQSKDVLTRAGHLEDKPKYLADRLKKSDLSRRVEFYTSFNVTQINELAQLYIDFKDLVNVDNQMTLNVTNRDTKELRWQFEILDTSQYCQAILLFKEFIAAKSTSDIFKGARRPTFDDVASAAIETGYVSANQVNELLKTDDIWNEKKSGLQRVVDAVKRFGGPALVFVPPPYNMISSLALVLVQNSKQKDDGECKSTAARVIIRPAPMNINGEVRHE